MSESTPDMDASPMNAFYRRPVFLVAITAWGLLVLLFALRAPAGVVTAVALCVFASTAVLMRVSPTLALYLLPAALAAGPIVRTSVGGSRVDLSDAYLALLVVFSIGWLRRERHRVRLGPYQPVLTLAGFLIVLSTALSRDIGASIPGVVNCAQFMLVYLVTLNLIRTEQQLRALMSSWQLVSFLCSVWMVWNYLSGRQLLLGLDESAALAMETLKGRSDVLFKTTHFYAGFFYVPMIGTVIAGFRLFERRPRWHVGTLWPVAVIAANVLCIFLLGRRTALLTLATVLTVTAAWRFMGSVAGVRRGGGAILVVPILIALVATVGWVLPSIVTPEQQHMYGSYMRDDSSLRMRFPVWKNAIEALAANPKVMMVGLGPNVSLRTEQSTRDPLLDNLLLNSATGRREGAIDSTYLTVALELGLPALLLFLVVGFDTLHRLRPRKDNQGDSGALLRLCVITWMVAGIAQVTGLSKPTWLLAQLMATSHVTIASRAAAAYKETLS